MQLYLAYMGTCCGWSVRWEFRSPGWVSLKKATVNLPCTRCPLSYMLHKSRHFAVVLVLQLICVLVVGGLSHFPMQSPFTAGAGVGLKHHP